jgi:hypothetical protein
MLNKLIKRVLLVFILTCAFQFPAADTVRAADHPDFKIFIGEWVRTDGGYTIRVRDIKPDGSVDAEYFNPGKINVAEASVSEWKGMGKLYIKLQDEGYPGSTYTLYYYPKKNALAGFYYQAAVDQTFEVVFLRK